MDISITYRRQILRRVYSAYVRHVKFKNKLIYKTGLTKEVRG